MNTEPSAAIGVIIVSYGSSDVIRDCLASLAASTHDKLSIVVCDNASPDASRDIVRQFAASSGLGFTELAADQIPDKTDPGALTLIRSAENLGYAGAVNLGLDFLMKSDTIDHFWVLNPDCAVAPDTAGAYAAAIARAGDFALMGGRTLFHGDDGIIQTDGGTVNLWTGICSSVNAGLKQADATPPRADQLDFISGANLIASRKFVEQAGPMRDDYFLYYEEVEWAMRRGALPLVLCHEAIVFHHGGTAIGSGTNRRRASGFANYFNYRNRARFIRQHRPMAFPVTYLYSALKVLRLLATGAREEAQGAWRGLNDMAPPDSVRDRLDPSARKHAFSRR